MKDKITPEMVRGCAAALSSYFKRHAGEYGEREVSPIWQTVTKVADVIGEELSKPIDRYVAVALALGMVAVDIDSPPNPAAPELSAVGRRQLMVMAIAELCIYSLEVPDDENPLVHGTVAGHA